MLMSISLMMHGITIDVVDMDLSVVSITEARIIRVKSDYFLVFPDMGSASRSMIIINDKTSSLGCSSD